MTTTVTFRDGVDSVTFKDGEIKSSGSVTSNGTAATIGLGLDRFSVTRRCICQVDISSIPLDAIIVSADLQLTVSGEGTGDNSIRGALVTETAWTESSSFPTWSAMDGSTNWGTAGGTFDGNHIGLGTIPTSTGALSLDIKSLARTAHRDKSGVLNLLLHVNEAGQEDEVTFHSGEATSSGNRPLLTINYVLGLNASKTARRGFAGDGKMLGPRRKRNLRFRR